MTVQPPGSGTLADEIIALRKRIAEVSRSTARVPVCRARLNTNVPLGSGDTHAGANWVAMEDPDNLFTPGGSGLYSNITIPADGAYMVQYQSLHTGPTSGFAEAKVMLNDQVNTVAFGQGIYTGGGGGLPLNALRLRIRLSQGDRLYWSDFSSVSYTLAASVFTSVRTEIAVVYYGP